MRYRLMIRPSDRRVSWCLWQIYLSLSYPHLLCLHDYQDLNEIFPWLVCYAEQSGRIDDISN